jgi:uncharacterized membrane protein YdjX (TVP38/TMEM64 family)
MSTAPERRVNGVWLLLVLVTLMVAAVWVARRFDLSAERISNAAESLGWWAPPAFVAAFTLGGVLQLPGLAFIVGARLAFGPFVGAILAYGGAVSAVTAPFLLARSTGLSLSRAGRSKRPSIARLLARVETHPIQSVVLLRLLLWLSPPLNYALALTTIRTRDYVVGSALGLLPVILVLTFAIGLVSRLWK